MNIKEHIQQKLVDYSTDTLLIHSDLMQGFEIPFKGRESFVISHIEELFSLKPDASLWMPAFNYGFCKGDDFDVKNTPSQVGPLSEYFRKNRAQWRTEVPVFSFSGTGNCPSIHTAQIIDPFDRNSAFQYLYEKDAVLIHYGSALNASTVIHYAERISNRLSYRYDKIFNGSIITAENNSIAVQLNFHVRPMGKHLDYNWEKLENELIENNIITKHQEGRTRILLCRIRDLVDFWVQNMKNNPLYLLDDESTAWVEPLLQTLGRPFLQSDFETV